VRRGVITVVVGIEEGDEVVREGGVEEGEVREMGRGDTGLGAWRVGSLAGATRDLLA
jgi:hypothetical protein